MTILYLTYDGLTDPLGQSQILPYLKGLSRDGYRLVVLSFEKSAAATPDAVASVEACCRRHGIVWRPLRYHKRPALVATLYDVACGMVIGWRLCRRYRPSCLHARSDIPAMIGWLLKRITGVPLVFDMRGFWVQERVDGGLWCAGSWVARMADRVEQRLIGAADRIVVLTEAMAGALRSRGAAAPITVIPTCVDTALFRPVVGDADKPGGFTAPLGELHRGSPHSADSLALPAKNRRETVAARESERAVQPPCLSSTNNGEAHGQTLVYAGSLGTVYMLEEVLRFAVEAFAVWGGGRLLLVSPQSEEPFVMEALVRSGLGDGRAVRVRAGYREVPGWITRADAGLAFYKPGASVIGRYPTKIGEYLACGVPVVVNRHVPDASGLVEEHRVGAVVDRFDAAAFRQAADRLRELWVDRAMLRSRCRAVAEAHLAVAVGVERYRRVYESLAPATLSQDTRRQTPDISGWPQAAGRGVEAEGSRTTHDAPRTAAVAEEVRR